MPINEMLAALEQEGKEHCQKILADARAQAKQKIKETEEAGLELEKQLVAEADSKLEKERSKAFKEANFSVNKSIIEKKEELIKQLFKKLNDTFQSRMQASSADTFKKLAIEAIDRVKTGRKEVIVSVNKKDIENAKRVFNQLDVEYKVDNNLNTIGGLIIKSADGKITVNNTLESRAQKAQQLLKPQIITLLFGEK